MTPRRRPLLGTRPAPDYAYTAVSTDWRAPLAAAYLNGASNSAMAASSSAKSLAAVTVPASQTAYPLVWILTAPLAAPGGLLYWVWTSTTSPTFTVESSTDATTATDGTWTTVAYSKFATGVGDSGKGSACAIPAGAKAVRLKCTTGTATMAVSSGVFQLNADRARNDFGLIVGMSITVNSYTNSLLRGVAKYADANRDAVAILTAIAGSQMNNDPLNMLTQQIQPMAALDLPFGWGLFEPGPNDETLPAARRYADFAACYAAFAPLEAKGMQLFTSGVHFSYQLSSTGYGDLTHTGAGFEKTQYYPPKKTLHPRGGVNPRLDAALIDQVASTGLYYPPLLNSDGLHPAGTAGTRQYTRPVLAAMRALSGLPVGNTYLTDQIQNIAARGQGVPLYFKNRLTALLGSLPATTDATAQALRAALARQVEGIAYLYVRLQYSQDVFSHGIPQVSAVVKGKKVYDPRTTGTAWTDNVALCTRDYLTATYGFACAATEINDTYFSAAANVCDEAVTLTTSGSQSRYTCNGVIDTANAPIENLNALVAAMAGTVTYVQGQFRAHAGAYESTAGDITRDMLAGPVKIRDGVPRHQLFNAVQGTYVDPALRYAATDFPPVVNDTYTAADGGTQIFKDIQLPFTTHPEAAQRIAKVILEQSRQGIQVELTLNHTAIPFAVWDTVTYTDPDLGWDHKVFRVKKFSTAGVGPVMLTLQEEASTSYTWASGEATAHDPAPDTTLPNPLARPEVPGGVSFDSRITTGTGSESIYTLGLMWDYHNDAFVVSGGRMELQYKLSSEADWRPSFFVGGDQTTSDVTTSSVGVSYDLRIRAVTSLGNVPSNWVTITGAVAGSSGGVGTTLDWGNWTDAVGPTADWDNWTDTVGPTNDWGFYT